MYGGGGGGGGGLYIIHTLHMYFLVMSQYTLYHSFDSGASLTGFVLQPGFVLITKKYMYCLSQNAIHYDMNYS